MARVWCMICVILPLFGLMGLAADQSGPLSVQSGGAGVFGSCAVGDRYQPSGVHFDFFPRNRNSMIEIDGSKAGWDMHGFGPLLDKCFVEATANELCEYVQQYCRFELRVNGETIPPTRLNLSCKKTSPDEDVGWTFYYYYEFPAGYFKPGVYVVDGYWSFATIPCELCCNPETGLPFESIVQTRRATVSVVYP